MDVFSFKRFTDEGLIIDKNTRCEQLISPLAVDEETGIFLCDDKTLGFCFECQPLSGGSEKEYDKLKQFMGQNYPPGTILSFFLFKSPDIEEMISNAWALRIRTGMQSHPIMGPVFSERQKFFQDHTYKDIVAKSTVGALYNIGRVVDTKLIISVKMPISGEFPNEDEQKETFDWQQKIFSTLRAIGFAPYVIGPGQYIRLMSTIINWSENSTWRTRPENLWEKDKTIPPQCFDPDASVWIGRPDSLRIGDHKYVKVLSAKKMPSPAWFGNAVSYVGDLSGMNGGLHANYAVVCNVFYPDALKMKDQLSGRRTWANNQAYGPMLKFAPILGEVKHSQDIIYESLLDGGVPLKATFHVLLFADSEKEITSLSSQAISFWSDQHFTLHEDKYVMAPMFRNCLPLCADPGAVKELWRYKTMTSGQIPPILPIFGEGKGSGTPHIQLLSRNGQLMNISLHDSSTNQNAVVAAESGSGKSFLLNEIVLDYMSEGAKVWIIDAGKSYQKLCEALKGDFVEFSDKSSISLNPFDTGVEWNSEEDAMVNLLSTMASMKGRLDDYQQAALKAIMHDLWDRDYERRQQQSKNALAQIDNEFAQRAGEIQALGESSEAAKMLEDLQNEYELARFRALPPSSLSIDDVAQACLADGDPRVRDVGVQMGSFCSDSSYGRFFAGRNNARFDKDLTVLELDELQGRKHLRQVVLLQLISQIQREIFLGERDRKKIVIIDEAWDLLKEGEVASFMEGAYRKFRKYGGSAIIATQSAGDLVDSAAGIAIQNNSANTFYLGQKTSTLEQLRADNTLVMDDWAFDLLKSVRTEAGVYSEIFFQQGQVQCVGRLVVSDYQKLLYSTNPTDVNDIKKYTESGLTVDEAIKAVLKDRGQSSEA